MRMDKTAFTQQSFSQAADHQQHYASMSSVEQAKSFHYLMSVAFGFVDKDWPRMDKSAFQIRKHS